MEQALGEKLALPKRQLTSLEEFVAAFPAVERVMLDGTERPIQRAKDNEQQKTNYSGARVNQVHLASAGKSVEV